MYADIDGDGLVLDPNRELARGVLTKRAELHPPQKNSISEEFRAGSEALRCKGSVVALVCEEKPEGCENCDDREKSNRELDRSAQEILEVLDVVRSAQRGDGNYRHQRRDDGKHPVLDADAALAPAQVVHLVVRHLDLLRDETEPIHIIPQKTKVDRCFAVVWVT